MRSAAKCFWSSSGAFCNALFFFFESAKQNVLNFILFSSLSRPATTPNSERLDVAKGLLDLYYAALPLGKDLASSERQHGDDFLLLAMHEYLDVYFETGKNIMGTVSWRC